MGYDWLKFFSINQFESVLRFSQISIRIRIRISFGNWFLYSYVLYVDDTHEIKFCSANFFQNSFFLRIRIRIMSRIRIAQWNWLEKVILHMLKIFNKFGVTPQSFCENQNSVQDQGQDQDHGITFFLLLLSFNIYKTWTFIKRREFFFFYSCDYNTFSFYILCMWWESKKIVFNFWLNSCL